MKKLLSLSVIVLVFFSFAKAQPVITMHDMPNIGDTLRVNVASSASGDDYTSSGVNHTWDFSNFIAFSQRVDTFKSVLSTFIIYYIYFNNANLAGTQPNLTSIPLVPIINVYDFFKKSSTSYSQLGFGAEFSGTPLPVKYDNPDVQLKFPLTYGEKDSCDYSYNVSIPSLGYYGEKAHRVNYVDGWGTIITPIDTFPAMRVLSVVTAHDTIHVDTLINYGTSFNYVETEYKWYANNTGIPVVNITVRTGTGAGTTIEYNNKHKSLAGLTDIEASPMFVSVYPNPALNNLTIFAQQKSEIEILNAQGQLIKTLTASGNKTNVDVSAFPCGVYFVKVKTDKGVTVEKFIKD